MGGKRNTEDRLEIPKKRDSLENLDEDGNVYYNTNPINLT